MRRNAAALALTAVLGTTAACDDVYGPGRRDYEGFYSYAGTVDDALGDNVIGSLSITRQRGSRADVSIDWSYLDNGFEVIRITTDLPAVADLRSDGRIDFEFTGDIRDGDRLIFFRLTHAGRLRGNTIEGSWHFRTEYPTTDVGRFIARR